MSISAPEARSYLSDKIIRGAEEYTDGLGDLASIMAVDMPTVAGISEAARQAVPAMARPERDSNAIDNLRQLPPEVQARSRQLARTALIASQANSLIEHGRNHTAPRESRRLAIALAHSLLARHDAANRARQGVARRNLLH